MPSIVALINYINSGLLWWIFFCQTGDISQGFLSVYIVYNAKKLNKRIVLHFYKFLQNFPLHNINFVERNSKAEMGRVGSGVYYIF